MSISHTAVHGRIELELNFSRRTFRSSLTLGSGVTVLALLAVGYSAAFSVAGLAGIVSAAYVAWQWQNPLVTLTPQGLTIRPAPFEGEKHALWSEVVAWAATPKRAAFLTSSGRKLFIPLTQLAATEQQRLLAEVANLSIPKDYVRVFTVPGRAERKWRRKGRLAYLLLALIALLAYHSSRM